MGSSRRLLLFALILLLPLACSSPIRNADEYSEKLPPPLSVVDKPPPFVPTPTPTRDLTTSMESVDACLTDALQKSRQASLSPVPRPVDPLPYHEILDPDRPFSGSRSLGSIRAGALLQAAELPLYGNFHQIIERHQARNTRFGTRELIDALLRASESVHAEYQGAPLRVGNLSFRDGGPIPWSSSHEAGRDADLAFYSVDAEGRSVPTPDLITFDDRGHAVEHDLYFDIPRNWAFVRAILLDDSINVQWLFLSEGLKDLLLLHAIELQEPPELITRAASILHQPTDAPPHDDHLHLRIGCSRTDRVEGCLDWGPAWEWYDWHNEALLARTLELHQALLSSRSDLRTEALEFLERIQSPYAAEVLLAATLQIEDPAFKESAFSLVATLPPRSPAGTTLIEAHLHRPQTHTREELLHSLYQALRQILTPEARTLALARYQDTSLSPLERSLAIQSLQHHTDPTLIPVLLHALAHEPLPALRHSLATQLYRLAARSDGIDWSLPDLTPAHHQALIEWEEWATMHQNREAILRSLLKRQGLNEFDSLRIIDSLIPLLEDAPDFERYNLNLLLSEWTGRWVPREWEEPPHAYQFWTRWWRRNRNRVLEPRPAVWEPPPS